jgi:hypothetical protein
MRKILLITLAALALVSPFTLSYHSTAGPTWTAEEESDMCRQECAEDGEGPEECQMDCNTVA